MKRYRVIKGFDFYTPGQELTLEDVVEQHRRGNLPDLEKNGFVVALADPELAPGPQYAEMSYKDLQAAAKAAGLSAGGSKADLIKRLIDGDN